jgi:acetyl esterase
MATQGGRWRRWALCTAIVLGVLGAGTWAAFQLSPWPSVLLIRWVFDQGAADASYALRKHLPPGITEQRGLAYDATDPDALLDVYFPAQVQGSAQRLTTVVWVHGGGFVSGRRGDIANYLHVLAARGFVVVNVDYSIAPGATWPTPARQLNTALAYLQAHADELNIDATRIVLAGDSAGAQIAAEVANLTTSPAHAQRIGIAPALPSAQLAGTLLFCGPYDAALVQWDSPFAGFMRTVLWSYLGKKDFLDDPRVDTFSVARHVTPAFPPSFVSAGNADPLEPHSRALVAALEAQGVYVDALFFPKDYAPALAHEYQFDLDTEAGRQAMERSVAFLHGRVARTPAPPPACQTASASGASTSCGTTGR